MPTPASSPSQPVVLLAFADHAPEGFMELPSLVREARAVRDILLQASSAGLCEVVIRQNVTLAEIIAVFQSAQYRDRIAVFHFAGHADAFSLILDSELGQPALTEAGGFALFLGCQRNLQLVFLNACATYGQVKGLLAGGIPAVLATTTDIEDDLACNFSVRFYAGLAAGATVQRAYAEAEAALFAEQASANVSPRWSLSFRPGAEIVGQWSLPAAVHNPLFGLPPVPAGDLPDQPYRGIHWFRREDAPIFFGRGKDIRRIFEALELPGGAPIVLLYGQSGVGKSSLLAAGLLPRLEQDTVVVHRRRDQMLGLTGTLSAAVAQLLPGPDPLTDLSFADQWRACEAASGKPLIAILDQVEEFFTRPSSAPEQEMAQLLGALQGLFGANTVRPRGRLILAFRKEWWAELNDLLTQAQLARTEIFLDRLDHAGAVEAIMGPTSLRLLQLKYRLQIETGLAEEIAQDLLDDPGAAVAPTLQILLAKMWQQAVQVHRSQPVFSQAVYRNLKRQGLLLQDFLDQQLLTLQAVQPEAVFSGLALDVLAHHTTPLGTAEECTRAELAATYRHLPGSLQDLIDACRELNLLIDAPAGQSLSAFATRLAHDTLAPLVRLRFDESDAPGQRARRILESRVVEWRAARVGNPLEDSDLAAVVNGAHGMRAWDPDEQRLVEASARANEAHLAEAARVQEELETARRREVKQAQEMAELAAARSRMKNRIIAVLGVTVALMGLYAGLVLYRNIYFAFSKWRPIAGNNFPNESVAYTIAFARTGADKTGIVYCVGTWMVGIGCSRTGETWNFYQDGLPTGSSAPAGIGAFSGNVRSVTALAFDADDPQILYAYLLDGHLYRSRDGGQTWLVTGAALPEDTEVTTLIAKGRLVLAAARIRHEPTNTALYGSTDGGASWQQPALPAASSALHINDMALDVDANQVILATSEGLWRGQLSQGDWEWQPKVLDAASTALAALPVGASQWAVTSYDQGADTTTLWQGAITDLHYVAAWHGMATKVTVDPTATAARVKVYALQSTGDVVGISETGQLSQIDGLKHPFFGDVYDLALVPDARGSGAWLLLGHRKGLMRYSLQP